MDGAARVCVESSSDDLVKGLDVGMPQVKVLSHNLPRSFLVPGKVDAM